MKNRHLLSLLFLISSILLLFSCGSGPNSLDGSIKSILNIDFEQVQIKLFGNALRIQYLRAFQATTEDDVVAEITVSTANTALTTKTEIPFVGNATLDRFIYKLTESGVLIEDQTQDFPPVFSGEIYFTELSTIVGESISGRFTITFNSGLVMSGSFSESLQLDEN
jgi:hypothetical protein